MSTNTQIRVRANGNFSDEFLIHAVLHQSSVLHPLLIITVLKVLSRDMRQWCPQDSVYADLALSATKGFCEEHFSQKGWKWMKRRQKWDKVLKSRPSKNCGRQPLKKFERIWSA